MTQNSLQDDAVASFKGLEFFTEQDESIFAGRARDIDEIVARVLDGRHLVLYGRSGLGKTSLLLAGLFPELKRLGFQPVYVRTLDSPVRDLELALRRGSQDTAKRFSSPLDELIRRFSKEGTIVLVLDQFEEFFIRPRERLLDLCASTADRAQREEARVAAAREREAFVRQITSFITDKSLDIRVIFSLREDYLAALDDFQNTIPALFQRSYRLQPLTALGAREAIVHPLERAGVVYDEQLISQLVEELAEFDFDSARLQITCRMLLRTAAQHQSGRTPQLRVAHFEELKTALLEAGAGRSIRKLRALQPASALQLVFYKYLQDAVACIPETEHLQARMMLEALMTSEKTKRALPFSELCRFRKGEGPEAEEDLRIILDRLAGEKVSGQLADKIIRKYKRGENQPELWYELIHECLQPEIERWLLEDRGVFASYRLARDRIVLACRTAGWRTVPGLLFTAEQFQSWLTFPPELLRLSPDEAEFLFRSAVTAGLPGPAGYWLRQLNLADGFRMHREYLGSERADFRRGAANSAVIWKEVGAEQASALVVTCRTMAFDDTDPSVRPAAAKAFFALASAADYQQLRQSLPRWRAPKGLLDFLSEIPPSLMKTQSFSWWWRRRAARHRIRRAIRADYPVVQEGRRYATLAALISGPLWTPTLCLAMLLLFEVPGAVREITNINAAAGETLLGLGILAIFGLGITCLMARSVGASYRKLWLLDHSDQPRLAVRNSLALRMVIFGGSTLCLVVACSQAFLLRQLFMTDPALMSFIALFILVPATYVIHQYVAFTTSQVCRAVSPTAGLPQHFLWNFIANFPFVFLPLVLFASVCSRIVHAPGMAGEDHATAMRITLILVGIFLSYLVFVVGFTLSCANPMREQISRGTRARVPRGFAIVCALGIVGLLIWMVAVLGWDGAFTPVWKGEGSRELRVGRWPDSTHLEIRTQEPRLVRLVAGDGHGMLRAAGAAQPVLFARDDWLFVAPPKAHVSYYDWDALWANGAPKAVLQSHELRRSPVIMSVDDKLVFIRLDMTLTNRSKIWTGELRGRLDGAQGRTKINIQPLGVIATNTNARFFRLLSPDQELLSDIRVPRLLALGNITDSLRSNYTESWPVGVFASGNWSITINIEDSEVPGEKYGALQRAAQVSGLRYQANDFLFEEPQSITVLFKVRPEGP